MAVATKDKLVTLEEVKALKDHIAIPSIELQIPTGQWSGSSGAYTYTANVTNITANTKMDWTMDSSIDYLNSDLVVTSGSGTVTLTTATIPSGTIKVTIFFPGVQGEVNVQVLSDVYSKSQTDSLIAQSTAWTLMLNEVSTINEAYDQTLNVPSMANFKEIMFSVQRADTGRTIATTIVPYLQFKDGAAYATGYGTLAAAPTDTVAWVNAVAIWRSVTSIEIACNAKNPTTAFRFRIFAR